MFKVQICITNINIWKILDANKVKIFSYNIIFSFFRYIRHILIVYKYIIYNSIYKSISNTNVSHHGINSLKLYSLNI